MATAVLSVCALLATLDTLVETVVGGLLLELLIPKKSSSLAREGTWDPGKGIRDTPDSHTDASVERSVQVSILSQKSFRTVFKVSYLFTARQLLATVSYALA